MSKSVVSLIFQNKPRKNRLITLHFISLNCKSIMYIEYNDGKNLSVIQSVIIIFNIGYSSFLYYMSYRVPKLNLYICVTLSWHEIIIKLLVNIYNTTYGNTRLIKIKLISDNKHNIMVIVLSIQYHLQLMM